MATRTALLNGNVINRDTDFSKYIEAVSEPGVIEGLAVSSTSVAIGKAFVKCERTNGDIIYAVVYNNSAQEISGNGDVYIEIPQELIDNGELAPEDGSDIAEIKVGTMPSKNALKLATKNGSTITDERNIIKKVGELNTLIETSNTDIEDLDERVEALEEAGAIDHLEESALVGELYTLNDTLFKQYTPTLENSTIDCNVSNTSANKQIHIQRIGSGVASNQLKLKVKMVGSSTQNLKVEVRKGVQVTVTEGVEAYWYGNQVIASGSIAYSDISSDYAEKTVTLNANFGGTKGELLDIVVYMDTVNASNYYCVACDGTQYSEGFSYVAVNGSTRTRSKLMPYLSSTGLVQTMLSKVRELVVLADDTNYTITTSSTTLIPYYETTITKSGKIHVKLTAMIGEHGQRLGTYSIYANDTEIRTTNYNSETNVEFTSTDIYPSGTIITVKIRAWLSSSPITTKGIYIETIPEWYTLNQIAIYPKEIKELGDLVIGTIYGNYNDNKYVGGIMLNKDTTATTGSIPLGNAVGFIAVNLNGKIVKIPYYS